MLQQSNTSRNKLILDRNNLYTNLLVAIVGNFDGDRVRIDDHTCRRTLFNQFIFAGEQLLGADRFGRCGHDGVNNSTLGVLQASVAIIDVFGSYYVERYIRQIIQLKCGRKHCAVIAFMFAHAYKLNALFLDLDNGLKRRVIEIKR